MDQYPLDTQQHILYIMVNYTADYFNTCGIQLYFLFAMSAVCINAQHNMVKGEQRDKGDIVQLYGLSIKYYIMHTASIQRGMGAGYFVY